MAEPTLFDTIQNAIISDTVLSTLSPIEIQSLSLTCRTAQDAITSYRRCAWNIDNRLRRHFHDPLAFRSLQAKTDTIISGRFALDFFARTTSLETPLDICVPLEHFLEVGKWLLNETSGGYRFQPSETQLQNFEEMLMKPRDHINIVVPENLEDHFTGIAAGFDFVHLEDPAVKVRMSVAESSVFKIVFNASSTCVMNIIAFDKAYSLYPRSSFHHYQAVVTSHGEGNHKLDIRECEEKGWTMENDADPKAYPRVSRWVGDSSCWLIPFSLKGVELPETSQRFPMDLNGWNLAPTRREHELSLPNKDWRARCIVLRSPALKFRYSLPKTNFWVDFLAQWAHFPKKCDHGNSLYEDADVRTHIDFCRRFSSNLDATIDEEQRSHHRTLVAYNRELKILQQRMDASEQKLAKTDILEEQIHVMDAKVREISGKVNEFVEDISEWVKNGQDPLCFEELVLRFKKHAPEL